MVYSEDYELLLEILGVGRKLADKLGVKLSAILMGHDLDEEKSSLHKYGADKVYVLEDPILENFNVEPYRDALLEVVNTYPPNSIIIGGTKRGKELAPRVAASLETGCITDCTYLDFDEESRLVGQRLTYGGSTIADVVCTKKPYMATVPSRVFEKLEPSEREGEIIMLDFEVTEPKTKIVERKEKQKMGFDVGSAPLIISVGRGLKKKEDLKLLEELAEVLDTGIGCSRPLAADYNWLEEWIGLSGHTVKPDLYIACGISGTIQHVAGIRDSKIIVAINTNEEAPIFSISDYGIVGDLYKIVPALTKVLKEKLVK
jgi:electron transfer flavoprotein alpha subunit